MRQQRDIGYAEWRIPDMQSCMAGQRPHLSSWDDLRLVLSIAQTGSLSLAAKRLGTDQSTVSRRLNQLEVAMQGTVFERTGRGAKPTELGVTLIRAAEQVELSVGAVYDAIAHSKEVEGVVRVAMTEGLAAHFVIPRLLPLIERRFPKLRVHVLTNERVVDLREEDADLALRFAKSKQSGLVCRKIGQLQLSLLAKSSKVTHFRRLLLRDVPFLACVPESRNAWLSERGLPAPRHAFTTMEGVIAAIRAGLGVGVAVAKLTEVYPDLVQFDLEGVTFPKLPLYVVTRSAIRHSPRIDALFRFFSEELRGIVG